MAKFVDCDIFRIVLRLRQDKIVWYESPLLAAIGVPHAFSTRIGGVSRPPFDSLNLGNPNGCEVQDSTDQIAENYRLLQSAIGVADRTLLRLHQIHGNVVSVAGDGIEKGDALIVQSPGQIASMRVADCVPVLLTTQDGLVVAAVHAGWRGLIAGVVLAALQKLRQIRDVPILAAIGPCIGFDAFEVGPEVLEAFQNVFGSNAPIRRRSDGKGHVNLRRAIALQLIHAGVRPEWIDFTDRCTFRDKEEFFSHRRDNGVTGRMAAIVTPRAGPRSASAQS